MVNIQSYEELATIMRADGNLLTQMFAYGAQ